MHDLSLKKKIIFSIIPAAILFLAMELTLRVTNFYFSTTPLFMGLPEDILRTNNYGEMDKAAGFEVRYCKDSLLLWTLDPKSKDINSYGFRGKDIDIIKPKNSKRIVCLGCSCTMSGSIPYPQYLEDFLKKKIQKYNVEIINASCGSFSSLQGLRLLKTKVRKFKPDYITIFFGWNDHWVALSGIEDKNIVVQSDVIIEIKNFLNNFRVYQLFVKMALALKGKLNKQGYIKSTIKFRVSLTDYIDNLNQMIKICRDINTVPILITAPTSLNKDNPSLDIICKSVFPNKEIFNIVHSQYNNVLRKVALDNKIILLDLAEIMKGFDNIDEYFMRDGIHFSVSGRILVAQKLSEVILDDISSNTDI